jgi:hypothetical protein
VRVTGKIFQNKKLSAIFSGWKGWSVFGVVNSGQQALCQRDWVTHPHQRAATKGDNSPSSSTK